MASIHTAPDQISAEDSVDTLGTGPQVTATTQQRQAHVATPGSDAIDTGSVPAPKRKPSRRSGRAKNRCEQLMHVMSQQLDQQLDQLDQLTEYPAEIDGELEEICTAIDRLTNRMSIIAEGQKRLKQGDINLGHFSKRAKAPAPSRLEIFSVRDRSGDDARQPQSESNDAEHAVQGARRTEPVFQEQQVQSRGEALGSAK